MVLEQGSDQGGVGGVALGKLTALGALTAVLSQQAVVEVSRVNQVAVMG